MKSKKVASALLAASVVATAVPAVAVQAAVTPAETAAKTALAKAEASLSQADWNSAVLAANKIADKNIKEWYLQKLFVVQRLVAAKNIKATVDNLKATGKVLDVTAQANLAKTFESEATKVNSFKGLNNDLKNVILNVYFEEVKRANAVNVVEAKAKAGTLTEAELAAEKANVAKLVNTTLRNQLLTTLNAVKIENTYELKLENVKVVNASTIEVTFNKVVDETIAKNTATYVIEKVGGASYAVNLAELKADGKTVVLTNNTVALEKDKDYTIVVQGVKVANEDTAYNFARVFRATADVTAPVLVSATAAAGESGTSSVDVSFDESVDIAGLKAPVFKVNGSIVPGIQSGTDYRSFSLLLPSAVKSGTSLAITVENVYDVAANKGTTAKTIVVASDLAAPEVVSVTVDTDTSLKVKFNEKVNAATLVTAGNVAVTANGMVDAKTGITPSSGLVDEVVINLSAGTLYSSTTKSRSLNVTFKNLTDAFGNVAKVDTNKTVTITKDEVKPALVSLTHKKDATVDPAVSTFVAKLSEAVTVDGTITLKMVDADGVLANVSATTTKIDKNGVATSDPSDTILITVGSLLKNGTYKVTLPAGEFTDTATAVNTNDAATVTVAIADGAVSASVGAPVVSSVSYASGAITVNFDKAVNTTAINPANYKVNNNVLPAGTEITLNAAKTTATITVPSGFIKKDVTNPVLTVSGIQSTDGGQLVSVAKTITATLLETVAPVLTKAEYTADGTIKLYFDEETSVASGTFDVYYGGTAVASSVSIGSAVTDAGDAAGDDGKVTVTVTGITAINASNQSALTIKVAKDGIQDANSNKIAETAVNVIDKSVHVAGTLGVTHTAATKNFNVKLSTSPAVEAGSTAMIYIVQDGEAAITADNYTSFAPISTQAAANLATAGLNFSVSKDTYGLDLAATQDYDVYVVVKDASGNVIVKTAAVSTTTIQ